MPDRDFDKSIQRKANELRLEPSPEVWERVAAQINEKDRRRGFAWYWLAAAIVAGALSLWFIGPITQTTPHDSTVTSSASDPLENKNQPATATQEPTALTSETAGTTDNTSSSAEKTSTSSQDALAAKKDPLTASANGSNKAANSAEGATEISGSTARSTSSSKTNGIAKSGTTAKSNSAAIKKQGLSNQEQQSLRIAKNKRQLPADATPLTATINAADEKELYGKSLYPQSSLPQSGDIQPDPATEGDTKLNADLLAATPKPTQKKESWNLAMQIGGGSGSLREGLGTVAEATPQNAFTNIALRPPGTSAALDPRPSDIKAGPSFQASIGLSRPISRKLNFITGIQYAYFSNRIKVGREIDSSALNTNFRLQNISATAAYTGAGNEGNTYYNAYHYLQVPFEIGWFLDNGKKLSWNNGFLLGFLLQTDALHYDESAGAYYQNNDLVNKFQTSAQSSLNYRLFRTGSGSLSAGPFVNYQLSNIDKTAGNKRLLTFGLNARFLFNKTK